MIARLSAFAKGAYLVVIDALDMAGSDGRVSFQKWVLLVVLYAAAKTDAPPLVLVAVLAASFGRSVFSLFLNRGSFNASASTVRQHATVDVRLPDAFKDDER